MERGGSVYIMTNQNNTVLYTGVTSDIKSRIIEHKEKLRLGFTTKYNVNKLVYFKTFLRIEEAIEMEKKIKAGNRKKKMELINSMNPKWLDLFNEI